MSNTSFCTFQASVDVYWRYCPADDQEGHIDAIVDELFRALSGPHRRWNAWSRAIVRAQLRNRLEQAAVGELKPVDHVKSLRSGRTGLFEIRWLDIAVYDETPSGDKRHYETGARLIHAEPADQLGIAMLGLVAHEKANRDDAKRLQDEHIDEAEALFSRGFDETWGVSRRSPAQGRRSDIDSNL